MATLNKVMLIGNIGSIDIKTFDNGRIANASLATSDRYSGKDGERREETTWHRVVFFGSLVDIVEKYVHKGDMVFVEGKMRYRKFTNNEGKESSVAEVLAARLEFISHSKTENQRINIDDIF